MVDKQKLLEQLRKLKKQIQSDPQVKALYDTDGDGNISGEEWDRARQSVMAFMKATESGKPAAGNKRSGAAGAAGMAIAGAAGAADAVFGQIKERAGQASFADRCTLWTERSVVVKQEVSTTEMMSSHDAPNRYKFFTEKGRELANAVEYRSSGFKRMGHSGRPPFKMNITVNGTSEVLHLDRHYDFGHSQLEVASNDIPVGVIEEKSLAEGNYYELSPDQGTRTLKVEKPVLLGWTFTITAGPGQVGLIEKKWGGVMKEAFTSADNFRISFESPSLTTSERRLIVAAVILIDMNHFETSEKDGKSGGISFSSWS